MPVKITGPTKADVSLRGDIATEDTFAALVRTLDSVASSLHGFVTVDDLNKIQGTWAGEVDGLLEHVKNAFTDGAAITRINIHATTVDLLKKKSLTAAAGVDVIPPSDPFAVPLVENPAATEFLANARNRLVAVGDDAWGAARDQLVQGMQAGEGVASLRQRVQDSVNFSAQRAEVVARSEVAHAMNQGSIAQVGALDVPMMKEWIAVMDDRTRPEHAEMDGQQVPLDGTFPIGFDPGDDYNCRCTIGFSTPTPSQGGDDLGSTEDSFLENACACPNPLLASALVASAFAGYDPEYAKRYREKKAAEKAAKEAGQPPPPASPPLKYKAPKVERAVKQKVEEVRQEAETLTSPCSCAPIVPSMTVRNQALTGDAIHSMSGMKNFGNLKAGDVKALAKYQNGELNGDYAYQVMNSWLRKGNHTPGNKVNIIDRAIHGVDNVLDKSKLDSDVRVYRGVPYGDRTFGEQWTKNDMTGVTWVNDGFTSTTTNQEVANVFLTDLGESVESDSKVVFDIFIPKNTRAVSLTDGPPFGNPRINSQRELLLGHGQKFRVIKDNGFVDDVRHLDVELIPNG